jgi:hemerythrin-like domain-containing protein
MKITQALQAEHVVFHNLFDWVERQAPRARTLSEVRMLAGLLDSMLAVHSKVEDVLLVEPLEPSLHQLGQHENFHAEHDEIDRQLEAARGARAVVKARQHLARAVTLSRRHFDKEERIIFPMAEKVLSARTLTHLGERWAAERKDLVA